VPLTQIPASAPVSCRSATGDNTFVRVFYKTNLNCVVSDMLYNIVCKVERFVLTN